MRSHLAKVNEITNQLNNVDQALKNRPTHEDVEKTMEKLNNLVTLKAFQGLQRVVMMKAEDVTVEELRVQVDNLIHRANNLDKKTEEQAK